MTSFDFKTLVLLFDIVRKAREFENGMVVANQAFAVILHDYVRHARSKAIRPTAEGVISTWGSHDVDNDRLVLALPAGTAGGVRPIRIDLKDLASAFRGRVLAIRPELPRKLRRPNHKPARQLKPAPIEFLIELERKLCELCGADKMIVAFAEVFGRDVTSSPPPTVAAYRRQQATVLHGYD